MQFTHLHCHTQYSLLDGACEIGQLMDKIQKDGQSSVAMTDHGNMFGAFKFVAEARKRDIKPIVGCEFYLVEDRHRKSFQVGRGIKDVRYHQLMLAKNATGYKNLSKLCSLGYIEGLYSKYPRIDKELIIQYHEGLIATSCCIAAEIPQAILKGNLEDAERKLQWWLDIFGEDYYIELQRHRGLDPIDRGGDVSQEDINQVLLSLAKKYSVKVIATNDAHYVEEEDNQAHDVLLCVNTNSLVAETERFKFSSSDYYVKTQQEMIDLFHDVPEAIDNTQEISGKIELLNLEQDVLLPEFPFPPAFSSQTEYLRHLVYEGAKQRYGEINEIHRERIDREIGIITNMGFEGYFLIVQDFIKAGREMGVRIGPGRGSAAGSVVAYCLTITDIDPIKYNLLFERFLNPERISMPDIDIDFDDVGRQQVIDYVVDKYGRNQVAQIITFGTMAARSSIRDVGRVMAYPVGDTSRIAKLVPERPGTKLSKVLTTPIKELQSDYSSDELGRISQLQTILTDEGLPGQILRRAKEVEGSVRNTGIHAAGVIIAPSEITELIPVSTSKDAELLVTQFDGDVIEKAGMLKMDFLGLRTLSIINDALEQIKYTHKDQPPVVIEDIPLDDEATYKIFQKGDTIGIFQFESDGMRKYLRQLKPTTIEDLIAMNALYRPGPMDNIPSFIARKHGLEPIDYPHPWLEEILSPSYGIMVYQEQIMQCAQIMADYSLGAADILRRAMGKKKHAEMARQREIFKEGATKKGVEERLAHEIFDTMAKFASYGFNRSHSAAYSVIAYQTAYLKAHYPAEFMAAVLSHNKQEISKLNLFLRESLRMGIPVLSPDVNESFLNFTVTPNGAIRFGLSALKGIGQGPVEAIVGERKENGPYDDIYDFVRRINTRTINKSCLESLAVGGALDSLRGDTPRSAFLTSSGKYSSYCEQLLRYGQYVQQSNQQAQASLFGAESNETLPEPEAPKVPEWNPIQKLVHEKEVAGMFLSGHPLDQYRLIYEHCTSCTLEELEAFKGREVRLAAFVTKAEHLISKKGTGWGNFIVQDYAGELNFRLFGDDYSDYKGRLEEGQTIFIKARYEKDYRNPDEYKLRIKEIRHLDGLEQELLRSIELSVPVEDLSESELQAIHEVCAAFPGDHLLDFNIYSKSIGDLEAEALGVRMRAGNMKVNLSSDFVDRIDRLGYRYRLLTK